MNSRAKSAVYRPTDLLALFFACGIAFIAAAAIAGMFQAVSPGPWGRWLALHLAFIGGVSQLVLGASQFFATAFLATEPPSRTLVRLQLAAWNSGAILLAIALPLSIIPLRWLAVALLLLGLASWFAALHGLRKRALNFSPWATRWYETGACFLAVGIALGAAIAAGEYRLLGLQGSNLLGAHMVLNLCGWFGGAIVGTLHTFYPSMTRARLGHPGLQFPTFLAWNGGVALLALGYGVGIDAACQVGWLSLLIAALLLTLNLSSCLRRASHPISMPALLLFTAQPMLLTGLAFALAISLDQSPSQAIAGSRRELLGAFLAAGWVGLTVLGSLLHLIRVIVHVRTIFPGR